jgi:TolA-binding protein
MNKKYLILLVAPYVLLANEPSAYNAGNLDSATPYGLTSSEKHILKNKQEVKSLDKKVGSVQIELSKINENYDGLRSVTEAINSKIAKIDSNIAEVEKKNDENISTLSENVEKLKLYVEESRDLQNKNQESIKIVLSELSSLIDSINSNYVSKKALQDVIKVQNEIAEKVEALSKKPQQVTATKVDGATLLNEATEEFEKKSYDSSKEKFLELIARKYKPARSNFYVGEIYYIQKDYTKAIEHYKISISLYDKASYIPTLLYHTGISFSKLNKTEDARKFFDALKTTYPDSPEAKTLK